MNTLLQELPRKAWKIRSGNAYAKAPSSYSFLFFSIMLVCTLEELLHDSQVAQV